MVCNSNWNLFDDSEDADTVFLARRDLLPWADPYIAALILSLEREDLMQADEDAI